MKRNGENLTTRIIGGKYKGKKITLPSKAVTRSSKARLRESLFNTLQFDLLDKNFIEMFGGSGSVGLEALSRGAKRAWFIELDSDSFRTLQANCRTIDPGSCDIRKGDAFAVLPHILSELKQKGERAYLYIDPPFSIREGYEEIYDKVVETVAKLPAETVEKVIVEHMTRYPFPDEIGPFRRTKFKKFGKSALSYYESR
ncbi:16S rRNA (guanine(966)-N(2))-methyltransferase RsmD [Hydrogenimonas sp. SS33]|uniref:16S rRNA (guanine(966)-N(2))-methyltransferase RsmD n=1 Tax=Hydrogenimonas leucolamina TaxID=2954236 RepID=UPI00336C29DC